MSIVQDYIDFDIGMWGEQDDSANDDIFISGRYESKKKNRGDEDEIQLVNIRTDRGRGEGEGGGGGARRSLTSLSSKSGSFILSF